MKCTDRKVAWRPHQSAMEHEQEKLVRLLTSLFAAFALSMVPGRQVCVRIVARSEQDQRQRDLK